MALVPVVLARITAGDPSAWIVPLISVCTTTVAISTSFARLPNWRPSSIFACSSSRLNWS